MQKIYNSFIMKPTLTFLTLFLTSLLSASLLGGCSDDKIILPSTLNDSDMESRGNLTRAIYPEESYSSTNPDLIVYWENQKYIVLNTLGNGTTKLKVSAPWNNGFTVGSMPYDFCNDIKREDGWRMLFHTFRNEGENPNVNYMCFYNQFTGYLKFFYYNESNSNSTSVQWKMLYGNSGNISHSLLEGCPILTPADDTPNESGDGENGIRMSNMIAQNQLVNGWNGFQIPISRYEEYPENLSLTLGAESQIITKYDFGSVLESSIDGQIVSVSTKDKSEFKSMANLAGDFSKDYVNSLGEKLNKDILNPKDSKRSNFLKEKFGNALSKLTAKDIAGGIFEGLKLFFGKSIVTENVYTSSDVHLTQNGNITTTGESVSIQSSTFRSIRFNLYELLNNKTTAGEVVVTPEIAQGTFKGLGVWTLEYTPRVYYNPLTRFVPTYVYDYGSGDEDIEGFTEYPEIVDYELEVKFNPMIASKIKNYDVTVDFVESDLHCDNPESSPKIDLLPLHFLDNNLYYMAPHHKRMVIKAQMKQGETFDTNKRWFYNWGEPGNRRTVAMVTVKMEINYMGKDMVVTETRAYKTNSYIVESQAPSNPERWDLLNRLKMRVIAESFLTGVPEYEP